jgi:hypothetical protein
MNLVGIFWCRRRSAGAALDIAIWGMIGYSQGLMIRPEAGDCITCQIRRGDGMVEELGINLLVPIFVFSIIIVGSVLITNMALADLKRRRERGE